MDKLEEIARRRKAAHGRMVALDDYRGRRVAEVVV